MGRRLLHTMFAGLAGFFFFFAWGNSCALRKAKLPGSCLIFLSSLLSWSHSADARFYVTSYNGVALLFKAVITFQVQLLPTADFATTCLPGLLTKPLWQIALVDLELPPSLPKIDTTHCGTNQSESTGQTQFVPAAPKFLTGARRNAPPPSRFIWDRWNVNNPLWNKRSLLQIDQPGQFAVKCLGEKF